MYWHIASASISSFLALIAVYPYVRDMLKGTTRPNLVTWGLWFLIQAIFAAAQFSSGASWSITLPLVELLTVGGIVVLGLFGYGYAKYSYLDGACLAIALLAIILWQLTSDPALALIFSVAADFTAAVPTLAKSYKDPYSETPSGYFLVVVSALFSLASTTIFDLANLLWPAYIFLINGAIFSTVMFQRGVGKGASPRA